MRTKRVIVMFSFIWIAYFAMPGPRQIYDWVAGSAFPRHPQYLFANSNREVCERLRRVVDNGKVNIYVENLSTHTIHVYLNQQQIRAVIYLCLKEGGGDI